MGHRETVIRGEHIWMAQAISGDMTLETRSVKDYVGISKKTVRWKVTGMVCAITGICFFEEQDKRIVDGVILDMRRMVYQW